MDTRNFYLPIFVSLFLLSSCSKDKPDTTFEGTWLLQASENRNCNNANENNEKDDNFVFSTPCDNPLRPLCRYEQYIFTGTTYNRSSSTTLIGIPFSGNDEGTYTISENILTLCEERGSGEQDCKVFEYSISENTMSLKFQNAETGCLEIDYYSKQ